MHSQILTWPEHAAVLDTDSRPVPTPLVPAAAQPDPLRALLDAVRPILAVTAGVVLDSDGGCRAIPTLPLHALLQSRSAVVAAARRRLGAPAISSSFLWPTSGPQEPWTHLRLTVLTTPATGSPAAAALLLLSAAGALHGLTPRELGVLGFLVEGACNQEIADTLVIAPRTVASHLEHILAKLGAPTRTLAAVRAEQHGLYVPADRAPQRRPP